MRDIPMFTTEYGVASLVLKEIPYQQTAYITLQASQEPDKLLEECVGFCRACGAERILCRDLEGEPDVTVLEMRGTAWVDKEKLACLFPVTEQTVARWRQIYNERMAGIDNAATLSAFDEKSIVESGGAYFVHQEGLLLGIGWLEDTKLLAIASVKSRAGEQVMHTLMSMVEEADMTLEVASTNDRAIRLYERLGFIKVREVSRWFVVSHKLGEEKL